MAPVFLWVTAILQPDMLKKCYNKIFPVTK